MSTSAPQIQLQQQFETSLFKDFAHIEAAGSHLYLDCQTCNTTCNKQEKSNLGLVNLEQQDDFESYSSVSTDVIYCTNFSETYKQWCKSRTKEWPFGSISDQKVHEKQRMEETSADVVNASPEMALLSESFYLLAGDKLNG